MKRNGKGTLLQRMMALLLSAVLTAGTAFGTAPLNVLAQENLGGGYNQTQESVSENTVEVTEEPQTESDEEKTDAEDAEESDVEPEGNPAAPGEVVEELETPGETDGQPETEVVAQAALLTTGAATQTNAIAFGDGWVLDADGKLTIESDDGMTNWCSLRDNKTLVHSNQDSVETVVIQTGVTGIADWAFNDCKNLSVIEIPDSVTSIGTRAFQRNSLEDITIPAGVTCIEEGLFAECKQLQRITLPDALTEIGDNAFYMCSGLREITIPSGVTVIGMGAFGYCSSLREITIPDGVTKIEFAVFDGCSSLTDITIPSNVTSIECHAFYNCSALTSITIPSNVTSIGYEAFYNCSALTSITIPSNVTSIGYEVFQNCSSLGSVTMESSTPPTLEEYAGWRKGHFEGCKFVTENTKGIKVPAGTAEAYKTAWTDWADYITDGTEELIASGTGWTLDSNGKLTIQSGDGMLDWFGKKESYAEQVISVEIENGVNAITGQAGKSAFSECVNLKSVMIPDSVRYVADSAFYGCSSLEEITLPSGLQSITTMMFAGCSSLRKITFPAGLTTIDNGAFRNCSSLTEITIPDGVTIIGIGVFHGCSSLTDITIPDNVTSIGNQAFYNCSALTSITIPSNVTSIGYQAFYNCSALTSITIPSNVTSIGYQVFRNCSSLGSVTMESSTPPTLQESSNGLKGHFEGCKFVTENTKGIKVPEGTADVYKAAWTDWADYIAGGSAATSDKEKVDAAKKAVEDALADIHVSNATTKESLEAEIKEAVKKALEEAGISGDVDISVESFTKTEATTDAPGSITAGIRITSGAESAEVPVGKTIDRLPGTPADKVAAVRTALEEAVKRAIDEALAGTEVTNDNAQEIAGQISALIPGAVDGALEAAGVGADEVGIGEVGIEIEPATADGEGSITVTIPVTSQEDAGAADSAVVRVPVTNPGEEENPDKDVEEAQKAVEEALRNITATNETTAEDILEKLREALGDKAEVEDIEEFEKEDATEENPGQISLSIRITVNGKTVVIHAAVAIPQLGKKTGVYVRFTDYYDMDGATPLYKYTGLAIKPAVEVYNNEELLTPGTDYTVSYRNNTKPGAAAALTVKGKGNFSGTSNVVNFTIINADIGKDTDHPTEMTVVANTKVAPLIMNGTKKLTTKDYQLEGEGLVNGKYAAVTEEGNPNTLTVKGTGSYAGSSFTVKVRVIDKKDARKLAVAVDKDFRPVYDGSAYTLSALFRQTADGEGVITVTDSKDKTKILKEGTDFVTVCTSSLTNAGTVKFTVIGMGEYTGSVSKSFKISPLKVTDSGRFSVTFDENKEYEYRSSGVAVDNLVVKYLGETDSAGDGTILTQGVDYKVTYSNHKKVSAQKDAGLKITFLGNYKGSSAVSRTFKVVTAKLSGKNTAVTVPDKVYTKGNRAYKSTPIVTVDGVAIKASSYTVSYAWATESEAGDDTKYLADNKVKITIADGDTWARVRVTVTPKETGSYALADGAVLMGEYYVRKADNAADLSKAKVTFFDKAGTQYKSLEYNGYPFYTPAGNDPDAENAPEDPNAVYVRVTAGGAVVDPSLYDVVWTNATLKGKATVVIRGKGITTEKGMAVGSKNQAISIKAMTLKGKTLKSFMENAVNAVSSFKEMFF